MDELEDQMALLGCEDEDWAEHEDTDEEYDDHNVDQHGCGGDSAHNGDGDESGPDDLTCAICLGQIQPLDLALIKGCEHQYCVHCILQWTMLKEWCPQCKAPFSYLYTHRHLDGTPSDYPIEEGVTLLKRARWFVEEMEAREKAKQQATEARRLLAADAAQVASAATERDDTDRYHAAGDGAGPPSPRDWCDLYEDMIDDELEEDEAIEEYYYSSAAGHARIVLGNRRWGHGGFMRSGRMYARPVQQGGFAGASTSGASTSAGACTSAVAPTPSEAAAAASGKGKGKAAVSSTPAGAAAGKGKEKAKAGGGAIPGACGGSGSGCSRPKIPKCAQAHHAWAEASIAPAAALPVAASPLGRSPGSFGKGSCPGGSWMAAAGALAMGTSPGAGSTPGGSTPGGSTPGSGRRAKRNARRAAMDASVGGD